MLCAELVEVHWKDAHGRTQRVVAGLDDISLTGACIQFEKPVPIGTRMFVRYPKGELAGTVRHCVFRELGYFVGIEFDPAERSALRQYRPKHLVDPRRLVRDAAARAIKIE
jgi:hypothetical protein